MKREIRLGETDSLSPPPADVLSPASMTATAETIAQCQLKNGMIPWFPEGHCDPWNHIEAAMALTATGYLAEAEKAYQWLADSQLSNGAWHQYYLADSVKDDKLDTNCVAYVATGVWHHFLATEDRGFLEEMWPVVKAGIEFVCEYQMPRGEVLWAVHPDGRAWPFALLTGSSSISHSLGCALKIATSLGEDRPDWKNARRRLRKVIARNPAAFAPKERWAMDWYYPVLTGAVKGKKAKRRMREGWDKFVLEGKGTRCVADKEWITTAETAECAIACLVAGDRESAQNLLCWAQQNRDADHCYWTGLVFPQQVRFPAGEKTNYSSAAMILAAGVLGVLPSEATRKLWLQD